MELVTLVNRTSKELRALWNGIRYPLAAHSKQALPVIVAEAAKRQNPLMGSEDPRDGSMEYLVGIEEQGDDCSPIEQAPAIEKWDRKKLPGAGPVDVVPGRTGIFNRGDVAAPQPLSTTFVDPKI